MPPRRSRARTCSTSATSPAACSSTACATRGCWPSSSPSPPAGCSAGGPSLGRVTRVLARHRGLVALTGREVDRVFKLWSQTVAAPVVSSFLFILVFGLSLGGRIRQVDGVDYKAFIVPGLVVMAMVQAAYSNNSSSVFQARFDRYIHDVLAAPMRNWQV